MQSTLERGWYWGSETFREQILDRFSDVIEKKSSGRSEANSQLAIDHSEKRVGAILDLAKDCMAMDDSDLIKTKYRDIRRPAIASVLAEQTTLSQKRIADILKLKSAGNVSQQILRFRRQPEKDLDRRTKQFIRKSKLIT